MSEKLIDESSGLKLIFHEEPLQERIEELYSQERLRLYDDPNRPTVFWDMAEICRQTGMNQLQIKQNFFMDERFKRFKVGRKWMFPANDTKKFLTMWQQEKDNKGGL